MYKKSLIEEIVRIKEIMSVLTESAVTSDNPFTVLRRFIQELVGSVRLKFPNILVKICHSLWKKVV